MEGLLVAAVTKVAGISLGLLMILSCPGVFGNGSSILCSSNVISLSKSLHSELFFTRGKRIDRTLFCKLLESLIAERRIPRTFSEEEWKKNLKNPSTLSNFMSNYAGSFPHISGRKLLPEMQSDKFVEQKHRIQEKHYPSVQFGPEKISIAASVILFLTCAFVCPCFYARRKEPSHTILPQDRTSRDLLSPWMSPFGDRNPCTPRLPPGSSNFSLTPQLIRMGSIHLNKSQIMRATHNFSESLKITEGAIGTIYKGVLQDGQVVAIERAGKVIFEALQEQFSCEIDFLTKIEHRNLVKLLAYLDEGDERFIITEYVNNGTLREHLDGRHGKILDFGQRLEIIIDVAHGLTYLHFYAGKMIIHRDVRSSNILLTENMRPKVAEFGLATLGVKVKGTAGYTDPYCLDNKLIPESDVYSFGILMVEVLTGKRPSVKPDNQMCTVPWAFHKATEEKWDGLLDPLIEEVVDIDIVKRMFDLAFQCAAPKIDDRPTMKKVGELLWSIRIHYHENNRHIRRQS